MGRKIKADCSVLSRVDATHVSLASGAYLTIGGQQYLTLSALSLNIATTGVGGLDTGAMAINTVYYVHAVIVGGVISIIASLSKILPTGFTYAVWTGWVFVSNDSSQVGIVANSTIWAWQSYVHIWDSDGTAPAIGNGSLFAKYRRNGDTIELRTHIITGTSTTYGTGDFGFSIPANLAIDTTKIDISGTHRGPYGTGQFVKLGPNGWYNLMVGFRSTTTFYLMITDADNVGTASLGQTLPGGGPTASQGGQEFNSQAWFPIVGWSATEL